MLSSAARAASLVRWLLALTGSMLFLSALLATPVGAQDADDDAPPLALEVSQERGFITGPVTVTLTATDPNATIIFSTAWGDEWLFGEFQAVAQSYSGPITISGSTQLRAVAYTADDRTDVVSHTYIDVSSFSSAERALMDQYPVIQTTGEEFGTRDTDERTIIEVFWPDGSREGVSAPAGIRLRKDNEGVDFRLYFRGVYGDGRLDYDLFPDDTSGADPYTSHDKVNLHAGSQDRFGSVWRSWNGCGPGNGTLMRDRFFQSLQRQATGDGVRGQYYLMFHRGELLGVKNAEDVPHQEFMEEAFGGDKDDYGLWTKESPEMLAGNAYNAANSTADFYDAFDVPNFIDYVLIQWLSGNSDWGEIIGGNNNVVVGGLIDGPYYHWIWDSHATDPGCDRPWGRYVDNTYIPDDNSDYRMDFADRVHLHFSPGGTLTPQNLATTWDDIADQLAPAVELLDDVDFWDDARASMRSRSLDASGELLDWLEDEGYASAVSPVSYSVAPGAVPTGTQITLTGGSEIWFTIDGTDPRASGGAISSGAQRYTGPVLLPDGTVQLMARVRQNGQWSAAQPLVFLVGDAPGLAINELAFHPLDGSNGDIDGDEYEFVELANLGSAPVDLEYFRLQGGVRFKFDYGRSPVVAPGEFVVIAENAARFEERYGFAPDGQFLDKLSNSTDEIRLVGPDLGVIDSVTYEDLWSPRADGNGPTLSYVGQGDNADAANWARSAVNGGSPGAANVVAVPQAAAAPGLVLNEWNAVSASKSLTGADGRLGQVVGNGGDWFELVVVNDGVDARGWSIELGDTDDTATLTLSQDPVWSNLRSGTIITIGEKAEIVAEDGTVYGEDSSYAPAQGDWWIHAVAGDGGSGALVTATNFVVTADDWQAVIRNDQGVTQWGPVGEGIGALAGGVGSAEIGELETDPSPDLDPATALYDDGDDSTFGLPNEFDGISQDLDTLRAVVNSAPQVDAIANRTDITGSAIAPTTLTATDADGDPFTWSATGLPPGISLDPASGTLSGEPTVRGTYTVVVEALGAINSGVATFVWTITEPEVVIAASCDNAGGLIEVNIYNSTTSFSTYRVTIEGSAVQQRSISAGLGIAIAVDGLPSGTRAVTVERNSTVIYEESVTLDCGDPVVTVPGAEQAIEVAHVVTCLAGNGRVDTNVINTGSSDATYRVEFEGLSPRQSVVLQGNWWRQPITGRPDDTYQVVVKRNGGVVSDTQVTVACDGPDPQISADEVQIMNSCRDGFGYLLFQLANPHPNARVYVIEFADLSNRSQTAFGHAAAVRSVTGRPPGTYNYLVRVGSATVAEGQVTTDC